MMIFTLSLFTDLLELFFQALYLHQEVVLLQENIMLELSL